MGYRIALVCVVTTLVAGCGGGNGTAPSGSDPVAVSDSLEPMRLSSPAFEDGAMIPIRYTCDGDDVSPPLHIDDTPSGTVTIGLLVDDPDAPGETWIHWLAFDIAPTSEIAEDVGSLGTAGVNSWGDPGYGGPCPPSGTHRYVHHVFALDAELGLAEGAHVSDVRAAMEGHILAEGVLTGLYRR